MNEVEIRELRYFVAVAEELNFSRAAERLGIAQPPLSRAIRQLERRLDVRLFERDTRKVVPTPAGLALLDEARHMLTVMAGLTRRIRRAARPDTPLRVTAKAGMAGGILRTIAEHYAAVPSSPAVEILVSGYMEQAAMVRDGRADVALLTPPYDARGLELEALAEEPRMAALPAGHDLTGRPELHRTDFEGLPVPRGPGEDGPGPVVRDSAQLLEVVGLGQAVALVPRYLAEANPRPDIVYRPVSDAEPYTISVAWAEGTRSQPVALFVRTALELYADTGAAARRAGPGDTQEPADDLPARRARAIRRAP
ncbi:LysR family transcriptional regulator [Nonomuraea sp. NPDC000554]|uniref:LysR family transcriptional regulator n=1 Tax=Nonomuraea sp. NPDC000554 TaxID=3154259 RepID=UPI003328E84D